jgi:hypothetical protein
MFKSLSGRNVGCLLLAVALLPSLSAARAATAPAADRYQKLVNDAALQFQLAFRLRPIELQHRQQQLATVVAAWRTAPESDASNAEFKAWLEAAIRSSMPGARQELPPLPDFAAPQPTQQPVVAVPVVQATPAPVLSGDANVDPFQDDPIGSDE